MNVKLNAVWLGGFLALTSFVAQPVKADEWNKRTEFQFSAPVEIPGKVLAPGKYIFELEDNQSDRNIVQVFSEDSDGKENLVATILAIPDYITDAPDKPTVHFEEGHSGNTEAIHSWYYPGNNKGWEFVYPKGRTVDASTDPMPAPSPVATVAAPKPPSVPPAPQAQKAEPAADVVVTEEQVLVAQNDEPAPRPAQGTDTQSTADQTLPQTGGYSELQIIAGLVMLGGGITAVFASRRKSLA
jgi:LPXTG-motif cell wall-anchored protein